MGISLQDVAGGALQEKVNEAFDKVLQNMQDPNTPWKNKRKINLCLAFEQNEDRTDVTCDISVDTKLAAVKPVSTKFCTEKDLDTGEKFGWGKVLDWIGVEWETYPATQMNIWDFMEAK